MAKRKGGIFIGGKGGFTAGLKEKAKKIPEGGMAAIGRNIHKRKGWKPNVKA